MDAQTKAIVLHDIVGKMGAGGADITTAIDIHRPAPVSSDILHALLSLGYSDREAANVVKQLPDGLAVGDGIRQALKLLAKA